MIVLAFNILSLINPTTKVIKPIANINPNNEEVSNDEID
jgi:hypothetical protein